MTESSTAAPSSRSGDDSSGDAGTSISGGSRQPASGNDVSLAVEKREGPGADGIDRGTFARNEPGFLSDSTQETPHSDNGKILGRFDTHDDVVEDWKRQNDIIRGRVNDLPSDEIIAIANERNLFPGAGAVPEQYDFGASLEQQGETVRWKEADENPEAATYFNEKLREIGVTQNQLDAAMPLLTEIVNDALVESGLGANPNVEKQKLAQDWGCQTIQELNKRGASIKRWALANLHSDIWRKGLLATAEGMKLAEKIMQIDRGAQPLLPEHGDYRRGHDPGAVEDELSELRSSEAYRDAGHKGHSAAHNRYRELLQQRNRR